MEKISGIDPKGEDVWTEKHGKRSELLESIQRDGPRFAQNYLTLSCFLSRILYWLPFRYNYHMWVHQWTRWQYDLDAVPRELV